MPMGILVNARIRSLRNCARSLLTAMLMLIGGAAAYGADSYSAGQLTMPSVVIGGATYSNMVVTVGSIVSGPTGSSAYGVLDSYDPGTNQLSVQSVRVGSATYYNVVVTVAGLVSIGAVTGADTDSGTELSIAYAKVLGGSLYTNVVISGASLVSVAGGMPALRVDNYDASTGQLFIPAVVNQQNGRIFTNVIAQIGTLVSIGPAGYVLSLAALSPGMVTAGHAATATVTVIPANGYTGTVSLSCGAISGGSTLDCSFSPAEVAISDISAKPSALAVSTTDNTPGGPYTFTVTATDSNERPPSNGPQAAKLTAMAVIQHVVIIFQENRTPDNLFQDPVLISRGADIVSSGLNSTGQTLPLTSINLGTVGPNPQNYDLDHSNNAFVEMYDGGKMDGANLVSCGPAPVCPPNAHPNPQYHYVIQSDVAPYFAMAEQYTFGDRMFQTNEGPSFPAHQFIFSGTSAPTATSPLFASENPPLSSTEAVGCIAPANNPVAMINAAGSETAQPPQYPCFEHATLSDLLDTKGLSWRYYAPSPGSIWTAPDAIEHICEQQTVNGVLTCLGTIWTNNVSIPQTNVLTDIANGQLAQVSWVIPTATDSDHAEGNDGSGPSWVASIVNAIGNSAYWGNTAIIITWDDWGGWFDHVAPKVVNDGTSWGSGYTYGFRVPLIVMSPYAKAAYISHATHDFGSILNYVETTFGLPSLGYADAATKDALADCFDLTQKPLKYRTIPSPLNAAYFLNDKRPTSPPDDD
jgi:phospholipase C